LARWKADLQLGKLPICVNISARQLRQADLAEQVQGIISQTGPTRPCCCWSFPLKP
jgi:EAL domain-containing protein (putative c-di-GMP-specific phosphodiesterase class I)